MACCAEETADARRRSQLDPLRRLGPVFSGRQRNHSAMTGPIKRYSALDPVDVGCSVGSARPDSGLSRSRPCGVPSRDSYLLTLNPSQNPGADQVSRKKRMLRRAVLTAIPRRVPVPLLARRQFHAAPITMSNAIQTVVSDELPAALGPYVRHPTSHSSLWCCPLPLCHPSVSISVSVSAVRPPIAERMAQGKDTRR